MSVGLRNYTNCSLTYYRSLTPVISNGTSNIAPPLATRIECPSAPRNGFECGYGRIKHAAARERD